MDQNSPDLLKLSAALSFGASAGLLAIVAYNLMRSEKIVARSFTSTSMRRAEIRRRTLARNPWYRFFLLWLGVPTGFIARLDVEGVREYVRKPYARAGYPGGLDDDEVVAIGALLGIGMALFFGFTATVFFGIGMAWMGLVGLPVGFLLLVSSLQTRGDIRQQEILSAMPYVLDLLVLILRSGTSLSIALGRVVADYANHPIGDELGQVLAEIEMGSPRSEALRRFAQRMDNQDITTLADSIAQSEELGWPLAETLARQSDRMASERILRAQSKAGAAGVMVMLPSTLVLLAAVILLFGPVIVRFMRGGMPLK